MLLLAKKLRSVYSIYMLNPFPSFLIPFLAPTLIRLIVGPLFIWYGARKLTTDREARSKGFEKAGLRPGMACTIVLGILEVGGGVMVLLGYFTQIAALALGLLMIGAALLKKKHPSLLANAVSHYVLLAVVCFSLILSGAGAFAFDIPL